MTRKIQSIMLFLVFCLFFPTVCLTAEVSKEVAGQVAENYLNNYQMLYGEWAQSDHPNIVGYQRIDFENLPVAHNFIVSPSGHILVAYWDEFSPVLLYSTVSQFDPERVGETGSIASWILPEIFHTYQSIKNNRAAGNERLLHSETRVAKAWEKLSSTIERSSTRETNGTIAYTTVGPLLTTIWDQDSPYNLNTPAGRNCAHTLTGCVATAWAQLLKYWNWPDCGAGSHSYSWSGRTLSANFDHPYDWSSMPNALTSSSTSSQIDAVARLMSDIGIAVEMDYDCEGSGSDFYADDVLDVYFKYKSSMQRIDRGGYPAAQWFKLFRTEFDATPARPVVLSIWTKYDEGHEVIADGYQTGDTDKVHVNLGWSGSYNGFYDITNNFTTDSDTWTAGSQIIVTHIEPDTSLNNPVLSVSPAGQNVTKNAGETTFSVSNSGTGTLPWKAAVISGESWLSITSGAVGSNSDVISCSYSANTTASSRTATIRVTATGATSSPKEVTVIQAPALSECTATMDETFLLHIPILSYVNAMLETQSYWANLVYEFNPAYPSLILFKYINSGLINNPSNSCAASTLSGDLKVVIPDVLLPDGSTHLRVELAYDPALSTDEKAYFLVTKYDVISP